MGCRRRARARRNETVVIRPISRVVAVVVIATGLCWGQAALPPSSPGRVPVLVELFTSEGCSTCPPADRLLEALDTQPVAGLEIVVLSEHVDYWNHLGWKDRYSSREFSERQSSYASRFHLADVYTPQMVVDGSAQMSGVAAKELEAALNRLRSQPKTGMQISDPVVDGARLRVHVSSAAPVLPKGSDSADVYVAVALNHVESQVARGENANRHLTHAAVVRKLSRVGKIRGGEEFSRDVELKIDGDEDASNLRVVAFLQDPDSRAVLGAAMRRVAASATGSHGAPASPAPAPHPGNVNK